MDRGLAVEKLNYMSPLDAARSCIGTVAKNPGNLSNSPAARSHLAAMFVNNCMEADHPEMKVRNTHYFSSLVFTAAAEVSLLREEGLAKGTPPQPGDICMISIHGRYHWSIIERVEGNRLYTIEYNTDEVRKKYEVWRKPGGWPVEKVTYILRPKLLRIV